MKKLSYEEFKERLDLFISSRGKTNTAEEALALLAQVNHDDMNLALGYAIGRLNII